MGYVRNAYLCVDGRAILKQILDINGVRMWWTRFMWLRMRPVTDCCEQGNEHSGSTKGGEFLDSLVEKDTAKWSLYRCVYYCMKLEDNC
jgi:hypothetical protein